MKRVILALLPMLLLVGCNDRKAEYARRIAEEDQKLDEAVNSRRWDLDQQWAKVPAEVKQNERVNRRYKSGHARLDNALRYIHPGMPNGSATRQPQVAQSDINLVLTYDVAYLERAAKAPQRHQELSAKADELYTLIQKICPGNLRAAFHLVEAQADLARAKQAGFSVELLDTATEHLEVAKQLAVDPLGQLERMGLTVRARDVLNQLETSKAPLSKMQAAHLDAARKCLDAHRNALAQSGNEDLLAQTAEVHLNRVAKNGCKNEKDFYHHAVRFADQFEQITTTELFVQENCPNNAAAVECVKKAHATHARWRTELTTDWWWHPDDDKIDTVEKSLENARAAIAAHPRSGIK